MATHLKISMIAIAITLALAVTITIIAIPEAPTKWMPNNSASGDGELMMNMPSNAHQVLMPSKRINRFLEANKVVGTNPRAAPQAADHCKRDNTVCDVLGGKCCHNKCMDLSYDKNNCGTCMNKCKFTHQCCRGQCVMLAFDKRHCGKCDNRCSKGQYCVYGMCNYG